ncbi:MAG: YdcH family protein [Alphaproteobacteria bacterium]
MSQLDRIAELKALHEALDTQIENAFKDGADDVTIARLKKEKLRIKDEISDLETSA